MKAARKQTLKNLSFMHYINIFIDIILRQKKKKSFFLGLRRSYRNKYKRMHWFMVYYARVANQNLNKKDIAWFIERNISWFLRVLFYKIYTFCLSYRRFALIILRSLMATFLSSVLLSAKVKSCLQPILLPWSISERNKIFDEKKMWCSCFFHLFAIAWIIKSHYIFIKDHRQN